jgi:hypothetical protein
VDQHRTVLRDPVLESTTITAGRASWRGVYVVDALLIGPGTRGLSLGYGILIRQGEIDLGLLSHECRHVPQGGSGRLTRGLSRGLAQTDCRRWLR